MDIYPRKGGLNQMPYRVLKDDIWLFQHDLMDEFALYIIENYPHLVRKFRRHKTEKED